MDTTQIIGYSAVAVVGLALGTLAFLFVRRPLPERGRLGRRGLERKRALESNALFEVCEPTIRFFASWLAYLGSERGARATEKKLVYAGDWLGLTADEFRGMTLLAALAGALGGWLGATKVEAASVFPFVLIGLVLGGAIPISRLNALVVERQRTIGRSLVGAIDLIALCMGAGLDFPGALRNYVKTSGVANDPLVAELRWILYLLDLGHARREALLAFADRVPTEAVKDFVASVVQAEEQGTPLSEVLQIQATMLRTRRTIAAEEAAAKAGVKMLLPMVMMFFAIILIIMGPFVLSLMGSGI